MASKEKIEISPFLFQISCVEELNALSRRLKACTGVLKPFMLV
jgi:hypothetical protein